VRLQVVVRAMAYVEGFWSAFVEVVRVQEKLMAMDMESTALSSPKRRFCSVIRLLISDRAFSDRQRERLK
jgi:hypothetical protein